MCNLLLSSWRTEKCGLARGATRTQSIPNNPIHSFLGDEYSPTGVTREVDDFSGCRRFATCRCVPLAFASADATQSARRLSTATESKDPAVDSTIRHSYPIASLKSQIPSEEPPESCLRGAVPECEWRIPGTSRSPRKTTSR